MYINNLILFSVCLQTLDSSNEVSFNPKWKDDKTCQASTSYSTYCELIDLCNDEVLSDNEENEDSKLSSLDACNADTTDNENPLAYM